MNKLLNKIGFATGVALASVFAFAGISGATTLEETATTTQASVLTEMGLGATLLIAVMLFVIGIRIVYNWATKASKNKA